MSDETPWQAADRVVREADRLEELIQLKMESGTNREDAMAWALEMRERYGRSRLTSESTQLCCDQ